MVNNTTRKQTCRTEMKTHTHTQTDTEKHTQTQHHQKANMQDGNKTHKQGTPNWRDTSKECRTKVEVHKQASLEA